MKTIENKIDFVIPWLDPTDEKWVIDYTKYSGTPVTAMEERFRDWGLLKYWFRGVEKFAPWVGKVFFVTYGHIPNWLNTNHEKLRVVKHEEYIPDKYLPTFSSHPIELNFHRIKDLSETFVYFNDDTFLIDYVSEEDFFHNGLPLDYCIETTVCQDDYTNPFAHILLNNTGIINMHFDKKSFIKNHRYKWVNRAYGLSNFRNIIMMMYKQFSGFKYSHIPSSQLKSTYEKVWKAEEQILDSVCCHRFRSPEDVNQYLLAQWRYMEGEFYPCRLNRGVFLDIGKNMDEILDTIVRKKYKMICINDSEEINDVEYKRQQIINTFETILSQKSQYEL